jgi:hypothetical protein
MSAATLTSFHWCISMPWKTIEEDDSGARQREVRPATVPADGDTRPVPDGHQDIGARPTARVGRGPCATRSKRAGRAAHAETTVRRERPVGLSHRLRLGIGLAGKRQKSAWRAGVGDFGVTVA